MSKETSDEHNGEQVLWTGNPTLWRWFWTLVIGVLTVPVGVGILILLWVHFNRTRTMYTVTDKRVRIATGIFSKESHEIRIQDIRSVDTRSTFGYGRVEFSTAASDEAEITFSTIKGPEKVRDLVKGLQD